MVSRHSSGSRPSFDGTSPVVPAASAASSRTSAGATAGPGHVVPKSPMRSGAPLSAPGHIRVATRRPFRRAAAHRGSAALEVVKPEAASVIGVPGRRKVLLTMPVPAASRPVARLWCWTEVRVGSTMRSRSADRPCSAIARSPSGSDAVPSAIHPHARSAPTASYETISTRSARMPSGGSPLRHAEARVRDTAAQTRAVRRRRLFTMAGW